MQMQALDLQPGSAKFDKSVRKEFLQFKAEAQKMRSQGYASPRQPAGRQHSTVHMKQILLSPQAGLLGHKTADTMHMVSAGL